MQIRSLLGSTLTLGALMAGKVSAVVDTSPIIVLSNSLEPKTSHFDTSSVVNLLDTAVTSLTENCGYESYIFVNHPNMSDRDINARTMPFLSNAMDKAAFGMPVASVVGNSETDIKSISHIKASIEENCNAVSMILDSKKSSPLDPIADNKPRVISMDLAEGVTASEADEKLRKVIGHLPNGNFFLLYRTTPKQNTHANSDVHVMGEPIRQQSRSDQESPYESVFRNYQFFSPALFMGLLITVLLISVFLIALNSVGSLQISTAAFEPKRQPPQKK